MKPRLSLALSSTLALACGDAGGMASDSEGAATTDAASSSDASTTGVDASTTAGPMTTETSASETTASETTESETTGATTGEPGCLEPPPQCQAPTCDAGAWSCPCVEPLTVEAGFTELEPVSYWLGEGDDAMLLESDGARLFHAFFPADDDACGRPLIVFFNGGPGASSVMLMTNNTAPRTVAETSGSLATVVDNPDSWTALGNLLYIDARQTGFSYSQLEDPSSNLARAEAFSLRNFNPMLDGADVVRVILRFLAAHPQLRHNPVVLVGESYGGTRATVVLNLLLLPRWYGEGAPPGASRRLRDAALGEEIEDHLLAVFPDEDPGEPGLAARQFGRQALLQPLVAGSAQFARAGELLDLPGSPIFALADALNLTFVPCSEQGPACNPASNAAAFVQNEAGRSRYDLTAPYGWLTQIFARTRHAALVHDSLAALLAPVEPASIAWLPASERGGAYRVDPGDYHPLDSEIGDLPEVLGALAGDWDRYFIPFNPGVPDGFAGFAASSLGVQFDNPYYGRLFLENAAHAETLITSSPRDIAIYSPAIPGALALQDDLISSALIDAESPADAERPGELVLEYQAGVIAGVDAPPERVIRFPTYDASHAVTLERSLELREDVAAWLADAP